MDPIADALIRIKNGYTAQKKEVRVKYSKLVMNLCNVLVAEGFVGEVKQDERWLVVLLKYENRVPALADVKRISKPGLRVYKGVKSLQSVLNGLGIAIISTPKGLMTNKEARKLGVGGEVLAEIW